MRTETVVFGGGCFWCTEAVFEALKGVTSVLPGYSGGTTKNPTYESIHGGDRVHNGNILPSRSREIFGDTRSDTASSTSDTARMSQQSGGKNFSDPSGLRVVPPSASLLRGTEDASSASLSRLAAGQNDSATRKENVAIVDPGHAEVIKVDFDPSKINFKDLLTVFFATHDPTTLNRQGADVGTEYRSAVFYATEAQKLETEKFIATLNDTGPKVVTEVKPLEVFYPAEESHRQFYKNNTDSPYCQIVINPKMEKLKKRFHELLKESE